MGGQVLTPEFWQGRSVFVTGHTGFKGSWLVLLLKKLGAEVTGFSLSPESGRPSLFEQAQIENECKSLIDDVRNLDSLKKVMAAAQPSVVLHLAAQALVRPSYDDPVETYSTNVMGTVNVLEAVRSTPSVTGTIVVTSDKCYENREWDWGYRENEAMGGFDPYSSSKGCSELVVSAYTRSFFSKEEGTILASGRAGNVVGGGDYAKFRLVPDLVQSFIKKESAKIRNPKATRPWQHVLEPLGGYLYLAERVVQHGQKFSGGWNFGPGAESIQTVEEVANALATKWGGGARWHLASGAHPHEAHSLSLDCSKARNQLGWKPRLNLNECLDWIVTWSKDIESGVPAKHKCIDQIEQYLAKGS